MAWPDPGRSDDAHHQLPAPWRRFNGWAGAGGFVGELGLTAREPLQAVEFHASGPWQGRMDQFAAFFDCVFTDTYGHTGYSGGGAPPGLERAAAEV